MKITVIGTGYVGLVTGVCLASLGHHVCCFEKDTAKLARLQQGEIPIYEPGLDALMAEAVAAGRLGFSAWDDAKLKSSDAVFIAVGTPSAPTGEIDLTHVLATAEQAIKVMDDGLIITKSTVSPGTAARLESLRAQINPKSKLRFASNPEFLREGSAVIDFMHPDRIVVGASDEQSFATLRAIYAPQIEEGVAMVECAPVSAEIIKYAANCYLAARLSFFNEISDLCEAVGASYADVSEGVGLDERIGSHFMKPGPGYGGSCFPKDTLALAAFARIHDVPAVMTEAAIAVNDRRKASLIDRIAMHLGRPLQGARIAVLGLAFKAETDDIRDAPALVLVPALQAAGAIVVAHDPEAMANAKAQLPGATFAAQPLEACATADAVVILTEWSHYRKLEAEALRAAMKGRVIFDFRNLLNRPAFAAQGFTIHALGEAPLKGA